MVVQEFVKLSTTSLKNNEPVTLMDPVRTRSGRVSKPPERYQPVEEVTDDYSDEEDFGDDEESDDYEESDEEEEETDDDEDADENGNLKDFVVDDEEDDEEEEEA